MTDATDENQREKATDSSEANSLVERIEKGSDTKELLTVDGAGVSRASTEALVDEFVSRIESGDVSEEERERLISVLTGRSGADGRAPETRIGHLQQRVSDIEAYVSPLERLSTDRGDIDELLVDIERRLDVVESSQDAATDRLDELVDDVESLSNWRANLAGVFENRDSQPDEQ